LALIASRCNLTGKVKFEILFQVKFILLLSLIELRFLNKENTLFCSVVKKQHEFQSVQLCSDKQKVDFFASAAAFAFKTAPKKAIHLHRLVLCYIMKLLTVSGEFFFIPD
jgi:hypothetical protein